MDSLTSTDISWSREEFVISFVNKETKITDLFIDSTKVEFSEKPSKPSKTFINTNDYKKITDIKNKIPNCVHWEKWCKLLNPYDKVQNISGCKNDKDYFKYYEIMKYFKIDVSGNSAHIGPSSSSFLRALKKINTTNTSKWILNTFDNDIGYNMHNLQDLESDYNGKIINENSDVFKSSKYEKVHIFSADINMDTSHDPSIQEQLLFHRLFNQIIYALNIQEINGHLIIKIFDTITRPTCQLIYYLTNFYENVHIIKPRTSRFSNSEKFIVAKNFKGIEINELVELDLILDDWKNNVYCRTLGIENTDEVKKIFYNYNQNMINNQFNYIERIIKCSYNEDEFPEKQLSAFQNKKAQEFCEYFGLHKITHNEEICKHLKKNKILVNGIKNCTFCSKCFQLLIHKT